MTVIEAILAYKYYIVSGAGIIFSLGYFKARLVTKSELYNSKDGGRIYMTQEELKEILDKMEKSCAIQKTDCETKFCGKVDGLKEDLNRVEKKILFMEKNFSEHQTKIHEFLIEINGHVGRVNEFMEHYKP